MLSPRLLTIFVLIVAVNAYPAIQKSTFLRPVTSLKKVEIEDSSPWLKFPVFGNVLESFPSFLPTIAEAAPKIETDSKKFQVIINVKDYKKDFIKVKVKGSFIVIQGAHEITEDSRSSIDMQFIQTYSLPLKSSASSVTAVYTSDKYLVVTAPIGSVINKVSNKEREITVNETEEPLLAPDPVVIEDVSTKAPEPPVPALDLLPPKIQSHENLPTSNKEKPIPTPSFIVQSNLENNVASPNIISIPLQPQNQGDKIIIAPTYAPEIYSKPEIDYSLSVQPQVLLPQDIEKSTEVSTYTYIPPVINEKPLQSVNPSENSSEGTLFQEYKETTGAPTIFVGPMYGQIVVNQIVEEPSTTIQTSSYLNNNFGIDVSTSAPVPEVKVEATNSPAEYTTLQVENEQTFTTPFASVQENSEINNLNEYPTETNFLRSDIITPEEPEKILALEVEELNDKESGISQTTSSVLLDVTTEASEGIVTTEAQVLLQIENENKSNDTNSLAQAQLSIDTTEEVQEVDNIQSNQQNILTNDENVLKETTTVSSTLSESDDIKLTTKATQESESTTIAATVIDSEQIKTNPPVVEEYTEKNVSLANEGYTTSEVSEF